MNLAQRFLVFCKLTCIGGSEKGTCPCQRPTDCTMQHPSYEKYEKVAQERIRRYGANGLLSVATDFSRFPAGRVKADGPHSGEHLREVVVQRLREGPLTIDFNGTFGYGSSFLQGAFKGLAKVAPVDQLSLSSQDNSIVTEVWSYINSDE